MSDGINKVILLGDVVSAPELSDKGYKMLKFRLCTGSSYLGKDGVKKERAEWHNIVLFGKKAESLAERIRVGSRVSVDGTIRTSGKGDNKFYEINANDIQIMDNAAYVVPYVARGNTEQKPIGWPSDESKYKAGIASPSAQSSGDDDIPF